jgi:hypothetical protein
MSARIGDVHVRVGADTSDLDRGLRSAGQKVEAFSRNAVRIAANVAKVAAAAIAAATTVAAALTGRAMAAIDANAKLAASLNTTSASLVTMQRAAELSGVDTLNESLNAFNRNLAAAVGGTGPAVAALDRMGLSAAALAGLPLDERVQKIGEALLATVPAAEQAKVAADLFGESGLKMLNILRDSGVIAEARRQMEGFQLAISEVDAAKVELANDALSSIRKVLEGILTQVAIKVAPVLRGLALRFQEAAIESGGFGGVVGSVFDGIMAGAGMVADAIRNIQVAINSIKGAASALEGLFWMVMSGIAQAVAASINKIIGRINALIGKLNEWRSSVGLSEWELFGEVGAEALDNLNDKLNEVNARTAGLRGELTELLNSKPSEDLQTWMQSVTAETTAAAEAVAKTREELRGLMEGEEVEGAEQPGGGGGGRGGGGPAQRVRDMQAEITRAEREASAERVRIAREEAQMKEQGYADFWSNMQSLSNTGSKKLFAIAKVAAVAQALLKARESVTSAYAHGMRIGGPPLAFAFAGAAVAATAAQIASLKSVSSGGSGGGGGRGGGGSAGTAAAVAPAPSQRLTVNLVGDRFSRDAVAEMFEQINAGLRSGLRFERVQLR